KNSHSISYFLFYIYLKIFDNSMNIKQQKKFNNLVEKIEKYAYEQPNYYRLRIGLIAIIGYIYILLVLITLCIGIWFLRETVISSQAKMAVRNLNFFTFLFGIGILRLFWVQLSAPQGLKLHRQQFPELFLLIDELRNRLKTPAIDYVLLNYEHNAAVFQHPRLGFLGWYSNYLIVGLPLMQSLSPEQFRSTLAHELAHLGGNHSRFSGWVYRVRYTWFQLAETGNSFLFKWFFDWYEPFFNAYSFVLRRSQEYEADRYSLMMTDTETVGEELLNIYIHGYFLEQRFWPKIYKQAVRQEEPPDGTITNMLRNLQNWLDPKDAIAWQALALEETTNTEDTHPCLTQRLSALGYKVDINKLPSPIEKTAAEYFFKQDLFHFAATLDEQWKQDIAEDWHKNYHHNQYVKRHLKVLSAKAQKYSLTIEEACKRAIITAKICGNKAAIHLFLDVLKRVPNHPQANYHLGQILLEAYDGRGIGYLKTAIKQDPNLVIPSSELLYCFYRRLSQHQEAETYLEIIRKHRPIWKRSQQERSTVDYTDKFIPHNLPADEVQQISQQLSSYPQVKKAYLVRKKVNIFPEKGFYILGIIRRYHIISGGEYDCNGELFEQIESELSFSGDIAIIICNQQNMKLIKVIGQVPYSCIVTYR
ncbi:MAG: M48 family metalloprotease, partial [Cyanobacteria bacterium P01_A01_bin.84]